MTSDNTKIDVLVREIDAVEGTKAWGTPQFLEKFVTLDTTSIVQSLTQFSSGISHTLSGVAAAMPGFSLDSLELTVELTGKGEVRLIAAASAELKGGIKLVFARTR
jgi:hypothetical protein